jgi:alkanesulfonate monooxygenase SsuD/methylene tetrahydromethanopterin reductase-like flavin-dependent oxidoreductase (luciferase family)
MVGGNGPNVTWRLAARHADELNLDGMSPRSVAEALPVVRSRCEEIGRDPDSLAVSVHLPGRAVDTAGEQRVRALTEYRDLGVARVQALLTATVDGDAALEAFAQDCRAAGAELA